MVDLIKMERNKSVLSSRASDGVVLHARLSVSRSVDQKRNQTVVPLQCVLGVKRRATTKENRGWWSPRRRINFKNTFLLPKRLILLIIIII